MRTEQRLPLIAAFSVLPLLWLCGAQLLLAPSPALSSWFLYSSSCVFAEGLVVHPFTWLGAVAPSVAWFVAATEPPAAVAAAIFAKPKAS